MAAFYDTHSKFLIEEIACSPKLTTFQDTCLVCKHEETRTLPDPEIIKSLGLGDPLPESQPKPESEPLIKFLLADLTSVVNKRCGSDNCNNAPYDDTSSGPPHLQVNLLTRHEQARELVVSLKRSLQRPDGGFDRDDRLVTFPRYAIPVPGYDALFWIQSIIVQIGGYEAGHYYTIARQTIDDDWIKYNDSTMETMKWEDVQVSLAAFLQPVKQRTC